MTPRSFSRRPSISRLELFYLALILTCLLSVLGPRFLPVVIGATGAGIAAPVSGDVQGVLGGYKIRGCAPVKDSFVGWERRHGIWREVAFEWVGDLTPDSSNPSSLFWQSFGPARWSGVSEAASAVRVTVEHDCGKGPPYVTVLGPFNLPRS